MPPSATTSNPSETFYATDVERLLVARTSFDAQLFAALTLDNLLNAGLCVPVASDASINMDRFLQARKHWLAIVDGEIAHKALRDVRESIGMTWDTNSVRPNTTIARAKLANAELLFLRQWHAIRDQLVTHFGGGEGGAFSAIVVTAWIYGELFDLGAYVLYTFTKQVSDIHIDGTTMTLVTSADTSYRATLPAYPTLEALLKRCDHYAGYFGKGFNEGRVHENLHSSHFHRLALRRDTTLFSGFSGAFRIQLLNDPRPKDLIDYDFISIEAMNFVARAVRAELSVLVAGEAGSAKTTFLRALIRAVGRTEPILTIEEAPELFLRMAKDDNNERYFASIHDHIITAPGAEGTTEGDFGSILKWALQESCRRMIIGEIPNGDVMSNFMVALSGHGSGMATLHASNIDQIVPRVTTLLAQSGTPNSVAWAQIQSNLSVVLHAQLQHTTTGTRRFVTSIGWVIPNPARPTDPPIIHHAFDRTPTGMLAPSKSGYATALRMLLEAERKTFGADLGDSMSPNALLYP